MDAKESIKRVFDEAMNNDKTTVEVISNDINEDGTMTYFVDLGDWLITPETLDNIRNALNSMGASLDAILATDKYRLRFHVCRPVR